MAEDADNVTAWPRVSEICGCAESIAMTKKQLAFRAARRAAAEWDDVLRASAADCPDLHGALADAEVIAIGAALVVRLPSAEALATARAPLHQAWLFHMVGLSVRLERGRGLSVAATTFLSEPGEPRG